MCAGLLSPFSLVSLDASTCKNNGPSYNQAELATQQVSQALSWTSTSLQRLLRLLDAFRPLTGNLGSLLEDGDVNLEQMVRHEGGSASTDQVRMCMCVFERAYVKMTVLSTVS